MEPSFEKLLARPAERDVQFVVVGGVAVTMHGYVRLTEDVGILIDGARDNVERLLRVMAEFGEGFARELSPDDFTDEEGAIRIVEETEQLQVDIFTRMSGRHFNDAAADADRFDVSGRHVLIASKQSLIEWKEASGRDKDRIDALALRKLQSDPHAFD